MSTAIPITINFITGNKHKLKEAKSILGDTVELLNQKIELPEIQGSLEEIARDKCRRAAIAFNGPVLVEDSALGFNALNGLPGPYIRQFFSALRNDGLYKLLTPYDDKTATAVCTFAFSAGPQSEPILFQGLTEGIIVQKRGEGGFAFDPIFEVEGQTYAEMTFEYKNTISERFKALEKFKSWLKHTRVILSGRPDYSVWYGESEALCLNVLIVEAKGGAKGSNPIPQLLGYMGCIHRGRKDEQKRNCGVYGMAYTGSVWHFLKISHESKWSEGTLG